MNETKEQKTIEYLNGSTICRVQGRYDEDGNSFFEITFTNGLVIQVWGEKRSFLSSNIDIKWGMQHDKNKE